MAEVSKKLETLQLELKDSVERLGCLEVQRVSSRNGDIRLLCRCFDEERWYEAMYLLLLKEYGWYSFIGTKYIAHEKRLRYGWVLIFESEDMDKMVQDLRSIIADIAIRLDETPAPGDTSGKSKAAYLLPGEEAVAGLPGYTPPKMADKKRRRVRGLLEPEVRERR